MVEQFRTSFLASSKVAIVSHLNPDADALGTSLGLFFALSKLKPSISVVNYSPLPQSMDFLPGFDDVKNSLDGDEDLVIAIDCGDFRRLGIQKGSFLLVNIDHHFTNSRYGDINFIDENAVSCANVAIALLDAAKIDFDKNSATCFYSALAADSGFFRYDKVDAGTFKLAARLVQTGADPYNIASLMTQRKTLSKITIFVKIMDTLEVLASGKLAYVYATEEMLREAQAQSDEADGSAESIVGIVGVEIGLFLREQNGFIRGSIRTKGLVDASQVAAMFDGGGHKNAAGFTMELNDKESFGSQKNSVVDLIIEYLKRLDEARK